MVLFPGVESGLALRPARGEILIEIKRQEEFRSEERNGSRGREGFRVRSSERTDEREVSVYINISLLRSENANSNFIFFPVRIFTYYDKRTSKHFRGTQSGWLQERRSQRRNAGELDL